MRPDEVEVGKLVYLPGPPAEAGDAFPWAEDYALFERRVLRVVEVAPFAGTLAVKVTEPDYDGVSLEVWLDVAWLWPRCSCVFSYGCRCGAFERERDYRR